MPSDKQLPALRALIAFEATVRLGSLTAAAVELGITQPNVSQRIRGLEESIGLSLFNRRGGRIEPTIEGQTLYDNVASALNTIESSIRKLKEQSQNARPRIIIAAHFGFAHLWLLPKLPDLHSAFPSVDIEIVSKDEQAETLLKEADICITFGHIGPDDTPLTTETIFPVCSPKFAANYKLEGSLSAEQLSTVPLLHMDEQDPRWIDWHAWFKNIGLPFRPEKSVFQYNNYPLLIQAAREHKGLALGWDVLLKNALTTGELVALEPAITRDNHGYLISAKYQNTLLISQIIHWIQSRIIRDR